MILFLAILVAAKLFFLAGQTIIARYTPLDDLLYVNLAQSIQADKWLGNYNCYTLAKLPGYSLWLALVSELGLPVLLSQQVLHAFAVVAVALSLRAAGFSPRACLLGALVFLFSPESISNYQRLLVRDFFYEALTLLLFALWIAALLFEERKKKILLCALSLPLLGYYSLVREEFIWILPSFLIFVIAFSRSLFSKSLFSQLSTGLIVLIASASCYALTRSPVRTLNAQHYGADLLSDQIDGSFPQAVLALSRVNLTRHQRETPISHTELAELYERSPALSRLQGSLSGNIGKAWLANECIRGNACEEFSRWNFSWALRDSAKTIGACESFSHFEQYFSEVAKETNALCKGGTLRCNPPSALSIPSPRPEDIGPSLRFFLEGLMELFSSPSSLPRPKLQSDISGLAKYYELFGDEVSIPRYPQFDERFYLQTTAGKREITIEPYLDYLLYGRWLGFQANDSGKDPLMENEIAPKEMRFRSTVRSIIFRCYPFLIGIGALCLVALIVRGLLPKKLLWVVGLLLCGILSRTALLSYLKALNFAGFAGYHFPTHGLFAMLLALILTAGVDFYTGKRN